jgi:hypothetical protein
MRRVRIVGWVAKATDMHAEYVMLIVFFTATVITRMHLNIT